MGYHLFLDDERNLSDVTWVVLPSKITNNWVVVRNYDEFVKTVTSFGTPDYVTFDHDLADEHYKVMVQEVMHSQKHTQFIDDEHGGLNVTFDYGSEKTGYDCCKWLVEFCEDRQVKFPEFEVHSLNPVGRERIRSYIENAKKHLDI
jgi:hypothetical protein